MVVVASALQKQVVSKQSINEYECKSLSNDKKVSDASCSPSAGYNRKLLPYLQSSELLYLSCFEPSIKAGMKQENSVQASGKLGIPSAKSSN